MKFDGLVVAVSLSHGMHDKNCNTHLLESPKKTSSSFQPNLVSFMFFSRIILVLLPFRIRNVTDEKLKGLPIHTIKIVVLYSIGKPLYFICCAAQCTCKIYSQKIVILHCCTRGKINMLFDKIYQTGPPTPGKYEKMAL